MDLSSLRIGIVHSLVGKNDGVSIVIDQTVRTMVEQIRIPLGNIFFLAAHAPSRFNTTLDEVFWHKNDANKEILRSFSDGATEDLEDTILTHAAHAEEVIADFVEANRLDLLIAHNMSHPYNFVAAVGLGRYLEKRRNDGIVSPRCLLWWHDSHFERELFRDPNPVVREYLRYVPSPLVDGIVFINTRQPELARRHFEQYGRKGSKQFFDRKTAVIPNTCDIRWDWHAADRTGGLIYPPQDSFNRTFLSDVGVSRAAAELGMDPDHTILLLQHTRVVPRKRIDVAIDFAFRLADISRQRGQSKCVVLLVSGPSGDEQGEYREELRRHFRVAGSRREDLKVAFILGEQTIFPHREIVVDRKYYSFSEVPAIVAARGGLGTYFSEVEGFGNNLLEMIGMALPAVINRFEVYESDLAGYGFRLPATSGCELTDDVVEESYRLLTDIPYRNEVVLHNLEVLESKLGHRVMATKLEPLLHNLYIYE